MCGEMYSRLATAHRRRARRAPRWFPAVSAFASQVIAHPHTVLLAAFGGYAVLAPADFGGRPAVRLLAYLTLAIAGAVLAPCAWVPKPLVDQHFTDLTAPNH